MVIFSIPLKLIAHLLRRCSSNLLYPKEDRATATLLFVCKACHHTELFDNPCTYRNQLGSTVTETAGITADVENDPTVGDKSHILLVPSFCTMCGYEIRCRECGQADMEASDESTQSREKGQKRSSC